jgi:hypothetical protein
LIKSEEQYLRAKRKFGECEYPPAHETTWYLTVEEDGDGGVTVEITVTTFAESPSASERVLDTLSDITTELDGACHTDRELTVDVLAWLRERHDVE